MKILIIDDHEVVRQGLKSLLNRHSKFQIVGEAGTVRDAVDQAAKLSPDVIVMDVRLPDGNGVEACREIRANSPDVKVIMLTSYSDDQALFDSIMAGASGYLLKQVRGRELVSAIEQVGRGESLLDPAVTQKVLQKMRDLATKPAEDQASKLSPQEEKILALIAEGKTNREIGQELFLSEKTVKNYVSNLLDKLNMNRRTEAAAYYVRRQSEKSP